MSLEGAVAKQEWQDREEAIREQEQKELEQKEQERKALEEEVLKELEPLFAKNRARIEAFKQELSNIIKTPKKRDLSKIREQINNMSVEEFKKHTQKLLLRKLKNKYITRLIEIINTIESKYEEWSFTNKNIHELLDIIINSYSQEEPSFYIINNIKSIQKVSLQRYKFDNSR